VVEEVEKVKKVQLELAVEVVAVLSEGIVLGKQVQVVVIVMMV